MLGDYAVRPVSQANRKGTKRAAVGGRDLHATARRLSMMTSNDSILDDCHNVFIQAPDS